MRAPVRKITPSWWIQGHKCAAWSWPDPDRCLAPTVGGRDYCPAHDPAVSA